MVGGAYGCQTAHDGGRQPFESVGQELPAEPVARLHAGFAAALEESSVKDRLALLGAVPAAMGPAEFAAFMEAEAKLWAQVIADARVRMD